MRSWMKRGLSAALTAAMLLSCVSGFGTETLAEELEKTSETREEAVQVKEEKTETVEVSEPKPEEKTAVVPKEDIKDAENTPVQAAGETGQKEKKEKVSEAEQKEEPSAGGTGQKEKKEKVSEAEQKSESVSEKKAADDVQEKESKEVEEEKLPEFKIERTEAEPDESGEKIEVTITVSSDEYTRIIVREESGIPGQKAELSMNQEGYQFTFSVKKDCAGSEVMVIPQLKKDGQWLDGKQAEVKIPEVEQRVLKSSVSFRDARLADDEKKEAVLPDGIYENSEFSVTGGTGKTTITCGDVEMKGGKAYAVIQLSSDKVTIIKVDGTEYPTKIADGKAQVEIPVVLNAPMAIESYTTAMGGKWITYTITITMAEDSKAKFDNRTDREDGNYTVSEEQFSFSGGTGKVKITCGGVEIKDGRAYAIVRFSSTKYEKISVGDVEYNTSIVDGKAEAKVPVKINEPMAVRGYTVAMGDAHWVDYEITIQLPEGDGNDKDDDGKNDGKDDENNKNDDGNNKGDDGKGDENNKDDGNKKDDSTGNTGKLTDGKYSVTVESGQAMFNVVDCVLTVKNGKITAVLTLSGTGYGYLYVGTGAQAAKADKSKWIPYAVDRDGRYTYTLSLSSIDGKVKVAAYSTKNKKWYDRTLTFVKSSLKSLDGGNKGGNTGNKGGNSGKKDKNNKDKTTENGNGKKKWTATGGKSAAVVNSSTNLADGTYTPDKFSFSGGTGRVSISCTKVTVRGGQAYATIVFSSSSYSYVKASGGIYYGSNTGSTSTFEIPVQLNHNNTIIGCTTKMSASHEITYSIFVYIKGAADSTGSKDSKDAADAELSATKLSEKAPEIAGLTFKEEIKTEYAGYYKVFRYEDGITCIEVDLGSDTDKEKAAKAAKKKGEKEVREADTEANEEEGEQKPEDTDNTELYNKKIVRYLVVPADAELPAGLDKEMAVIRRPEKDGKENRFHAYVASENVLQWMDDLEQLSHLALTGVKEEDCKNERVKELLKKDKAAFGGVCDSIEYKKLVTERCDLAVMPAEFLPMENEEAKERGTLEEQHEKYMEVAGYCSELGIPMFVDRSSQEDSEKGQIEWLKLYGIIFDCEDAAEELYQTLLEEVKEQ